MLDMVGARWWNWRKEREREREKDERRDFRVLEGTNDIVWGIRGFTHAVHPPRILEREQQFILTEIYSKGQSQIIDGTFAIEFLCIYTLKYLHLYLPHTLLFSISFEMDLRYNLFEILSSILSNFYNFDLVCINLRIHATNSNR